MDATSTLGYRRALATRLRENIAEIEKAIFERLMMQEASASRGHSDFGGIHRIIRSALEYGFTSVELDESRMPPPPPAVALHAREVAWRSLPLQTLLSRYCSAYSLFKDFVLQEAESDGIRSHSVHRHIIGSTVIVFERLIQLIGDEHQQETRRKAQSRHSKKLVRVRALLAGDILEAPDLAYEFDTTHIGVIGTGREIIPVLKQMARSMEGVLLTLDPSPGQTWAWIGTREPPANSDLRALAIADLPSSVRMSLGTPAPGLTGWRRTHHEALAALPLARSADTGFVQYSNVALLASALRDNALLPFLVCEYLEPLAASRDGGLTLRDTLRAYFSASGNVSSAAALLGVKRHTVTHRLRSVEDLLDRPLSTCERQLELALELDALSMIPSQARDAASF